MLKPMNIQLFAGEGEENDAPETAGKTYSEDYVHSLRNESAGYRTTAKMYESALRSVLGLGDGEEIGDLNSRLSSYRQALKQEQENTLKAANSRLVAAELRSLEGYDQKLLARLIDLSGVQVDSQGNVLGVKEAAEPAAKEFPAVKAAPRAQYAPQNPAGPELPEMTPEAFKKLSYGEKYEFKQKHPEEYRKMIGGK